MNQNARKTAKTKVEKDFYKFLNNSNFGNDCRSNLGNCQLELLFDGQDEISYTKKFSNVICKTIAIENLFQMNYCKNNLEVNLIKKRI